MPAPRADDDDDLDDLDDVLDQFTPPPTKPFTSTSASHYALSQPPPPKKSTSTSTSTSTTSPPPAPPPTATIPASTFPTTSPPDDILDDDLNSEFAKELQKGMESLMREMGGLGVGGEVGVEEGGKKSEKEEDQERAFRAAWEAMLVEGMDGMVASPPSSSSAPAPAPGASEVPAKEKGKGKEPAEGTDPSKQDFQAGIRAAFEKLKSSESGLKSDDAHAQPTSTDPLEAFLNQLNAADGEGGEGEENEEEIQNMLEMMMSSLMSKEVLYEPLKELADKFPPYLTTHSATLPPADKHRYEQQLDRIRRILGVFEEDGYTDEGGGAGGRVVELMGEMQSFGTPPTEIMGDLPPGFGVGPDGMPQIPEGCCVS